MSKPAAKAPEPSMEEILASIRRIISDESSGAQPAAAPAAPAAPAPAAAAPAKPAAAPKAPPAKPAIPPSASAPAAPPIARKPAPESMQDEPDVLELTEMVPTKPAAAPAVPRRAEPSSDVVFREPEPPMRESASRFNPPPIAARPDEQLLSQHASTAVSAAFSSLGNSPMFAGDSRTIEELVREMLRPMLKSWLDDNLPGLVERLVRSEIERVSRGR